MRVYDASTRISAKFGGIRDLSRHLSLNWFRSSTNQAQHVTKSRQAPDQMSTRMMSASG